MRASVALELLCYQGWQFECVYTVAQCVLAHAAQHACVYMRKYVRVSICVCVCERECESVYAIHTSTIAFDVSWEFREPFWASACSASSLLVVTALPTILCICCCAIVGRKSTWRACVCIIEQLYSSDMFMHTLGKVLLSTRSWRRRKNMHRLRETQMWVCVCVFV